LKFNFVFVFLVACLALPHAVAQTAPQSVHRKKTVHKKAPAPAPPVVPPAPLTQAQLPASPPSVTYTGDQLTITADNSTLGDILRAVHRQTGAAVDVPGNATERVVGRFGPGPVRDVMTVLLNGSHFNYVLLGSASDPNSLERVVLISQSTGMEAAGQSSANAQSPAPAGAPQSVEIDDDAADMPQESEVTDDQSNQNPPAEDQQQQQANPFGQRGNVKTPEQLLQELQQRQQQVQQQQQQANPQSFPSAPTSAPPQSPPPQ
jgi:hypothetical protein